MEGEVIMDGKAIMDSFMDVVVALRPANDATDSKHRQNLEKRVAELEDDNLQARSKIEQLEALARITSEREEHWKTSVETEAFCAKTLISEQVHGERSCASPQRNQVIILPTASLASLVLHSGNI